MHTKLHWIDGPWQGRLAIAARPRGGDWIEDEISGWQQEGEEAVVSLLTPAELVDLSLECEESACRSRGMAYMNFPIEDRTFPVSDAAAASLVDEVIALLRSGKNVVAHCRQGVGRASLIGIAALLHEGTNLDAAIREVGRARGVPVPETAGQRDWLRHFESLRYHVAR